MSHGQTNRLAINANAATIINKKVLNCGGGELGGNPIGAVNTSMSNNNSAAAAAAKVAIKINASANNNNNSELRYATVTIAPPLASVGGQSGSGQSGIKIGNNIPGIQHGAVSTAGTHLIHLIPLQIGNIANVAANPKNLQPLPSEIPLTIITKNNRANATPNSSATMMANVVGEGADIAKIIGTALPTIKDGIGVSRALMPNVNSNALNAIPVSSSSTAVINGSQTIFFHNQLPKMTTAASLQCVPIATGGIASIISPSSGEFKIANQFSINGNIPRTAGKLTEAAVLSPSQISSPNFITQESKKMVEDKSNHLMLNSLPMICNDELNDFQSPLPSTSLEKFSNISRVIYGGQETIVSTATSNVPTAATVTTVSFPATAATNSSLTDMVPECILPDNNNDLKTSEDIINSKVSMANIMPEDEGNRSDAMLIIDDSTDDENDDDDEDEDDDGEDEEDYDDDFHNDDDNEIVTQKTENIQSSPMNITHITNSVVLTKAKASDNNRCNGAGSRNLSPEPANVVLMKLPNALQQQQANGSATKSNVEIPIVEAFNLANNAADNGANGKANIKIVAAPKCISSSPQNWHSTLYMRSNSVPSPTKNTSPRSAKRCQSLNTTTGQPVSMSSIQQQWNNLKTLESSDKCPKNSSPVKTSQLIDLVNDPKDIASSEEPNEENNDVTFIELDDSLTEDNSNDCDRAGNTVSKKHEEKSLEEGGEVTKDINQEKLTPKDASQMNLTEAETIDKKSLDDVAAAATMKKDLCLPTIVDTPPPSSSSSFIHQRNNLPQSTTQMTKTRKNSVKNENDDQKLNSTQLICNENIPAVPPSTSSSSSSVQDTSPPSIVTQSTNAVRKALTPTAVRDHNRMVDANASTTRRLCRDSSIASALSMVSTFDMLNWKEDRIASARGTSMRFELNEFNLLQVHERGCPPRYRIHTPYERPIHERYRSTSKSADQGDPLLYLCRACKLYGPAVDFLAPEFCSVECLKRKFNKRSSRDLDVIEKKRSRKSAPMPGTGTIKSSSVSSVGPKPLPAFRWTSYLANMRNAVAAPIDLFLNPFPTGPNPFMVGMKVEAIDPENCSLFCVCTIVQIQGYRLRLNFDGYNSVYDFWVNADSMDIFPPGWCSKTNRILQPPRGYEAHKFDWPSYLKKTNSIGADKKFFTHLNSASMTNRNPFTVGMFLEADDLNDTGKLCVASVADVLDERIRVHFDGWDDCYDYWVDISSPYIHPCGWHEGRQQLLVPPEYSNASFNWRDYIRDAQGLAAPTDFFVSRDSIDYRPGMKLEVVDPRNPCLIRPATIVHRTRHRVKIHLDCWPPEYIFCLEDDSPDLHPIGWCDATGHDLEPPPGFLQPPKVMPCSTVGCRGLGNMDRSNGLMHANSEFCPYVLENWRSKAEKIPRVDGKEIIRKLRQEATATSILRNLKRPFNQNANSLELLKAAEKLLNIPYRQPTRGRPRNCDRLAAAAAALQRQQLLQQQLQQSLQNTISNTAASTSIKTEHDQESSSNKKRIKRETSSLDGRRKTKSTAASASASISTSPTPPTTSNTTADTKITIAKRFLCDYGPRLQQNYLLWRQNSCLPGDIESKVQRNPLCWTTAETCAFIDAVLSECNAETARYAVSSKFYKHDIDGTALLMLQQHDLTEMLQFKLGPAIKLCEIILQLRMLVISKYTSADENEHKSGDKDSELPK